MNTLTHPLELQLLFLVSSLGSSSSSSSKLTFALSKWGNLFALEYLISIDASWSELLEELLYPSYPAPSTPWLPPWLPPCSALVPHLRTGCIRSVCAVNQCACKFAITNGITSWNLIIIIVVVVAIVAGHTGAEGSQPVWRDTSNRHHTDYLTRGRLYKLMHQSDTVRISL